MRTLSSWSLASSVRPYCNCFRVQTRERESERARERASEREREREREKEEGGGGGVRPRFSRALSYPSCAGAVPDKQDPCVACRRASSENAAREDSFLPDTMGLRWRTPHHPRCTLSRPSHIPLRTVLRCKVPSGTSLPRHQCRARSSVHDDHRTPLSPAAGGRNNMTKYCINLCENLVIRCWEKKKE